jgi:hypothetical protein
LIFGIVNLLKCRENRRRNGPHDAGKYRAAESDGHQEGGGRVEASGRMDNL